MYLGNGIYTTYDGRTSMGPDRANVSYQFEGCIDVGSFSILAKLQGAGRILGDESIDFLLSRPSISERSGRWISNTVEWMRTRLAKAMSNSIS
jgi:hypothetical protein